MTQTQDIANAPPRAVRTTVLRPRTGWESFNFRELWDYRELVGFLTWRDISVRYKQTLLGAAWAVIQPFMTMVVFSIFFGRLAGIPSEGIPYPVFAFCALIPWQFFSYSVTMAAPSLVVNQSLVTKTYFPRMAVPLAAVMAGVIDMLIAGIVLVGMMIFYGVEPSLNIVFLPVFVGLAVTTAVGTGMLLSALAVEFRDVQYAVPFFVQFMLFATPVAFPVTIVPESWRALLGINPMAGVVEGFRWCLLDKAAAPLELFILSFAVAAILLAVAVVYFRRVEDTFADRI